MSKNETGIFPYQTKKGTKYKVHFQYKEYGITKRYQKAGFSSKKEAKNHLILKKAEINEKGTLTRECKKTFKEVYDEFLQIGTTKYKPNTIYNTVKYCNYVEDLYDYRISMINYSLLQSYFNNRSQIGIETNKCLKKALNRVFNYAVDCGYISINPLSKVVVQGVENHMEHDEVLSFDDFTKMINALEESGKFNQRAYSIAMQIGYYMGLRVSEVMALD
ncbi:MAG: hypothetical protein LUG46_03290 [Erysipelotrichaceae bacterium]|nr:hypothetical protein [Erysipelotrichaceae bacterium]